MKRQKLDKYSPSDLNTDAYSSVQASESGRILDYRVPVNYTGKFREALLPPVEVLFEGFGEFVDIWNAAYTGPFNAEFENGVDAFVKAMTSIYPNEQARNEAGLRFLNQIFGYNSFRQPMSAGSIRGTGKPNPPRTDGHSYCGDSIPCVAVEFKNEMGTLKAIPSIELTSYYRHMLQCLDKKVVEGSRLPMLGITVVGHMISFFAFALVNEIVSVPLTGGLYCLPDRTPSRMGSTRLQLYNAFRAAYALVQSIEKEAHRLSPPPPSMRIESPFLPQIAKLARYDDPSSYIDFEIVAFVQKSVNRHSYLAKSSSGDLVIKLTKGYSRILHAFCADLGCAPKLYGYDRLPGGIIAVAMEHIQGELIAPSSDPLLQAKWASELHEMVGKIHGVEYVHGDLRPPNIMHASVQDRLMLLDFDWGGKVGEAHYPHTQLTPELTAGRDMSSLLITKEDDERVLARTVEFICGS
ncbi:hypothetical protein V8E55_007428 [Tylopilus felleus]